MSHSHDSRFARKEVSTKILLQNACYAQPAGAPLERGMISSMLARELRLQATQATTVYQTNRTNHHLFSEFAGTPEKKN
jgi:hypothetical protein